MKHTLLIITALMLIVGCSESDAQTYQFANGFHDNGMVKEIKYHKKTRDGIELVKGETYYSSGQKESEGTYKDGEKDGKWTQWYENGQKKAEETYKDGVSNGKHTHWHENGKKKAEITYKDGELDGLSTTWYENGQKQLEDTYKDGILDGKSTDWYENGQKRLTIYYSMGVVSYYLNKAYESSLISFDPVFVLCDRSSLELIPETWLFSTEFWQQVTNNLFSAAAKAIIIDGSLQNVSEWYESIPNDRSGKLIYLTTQEPTKSSYIMDLSLSPYNSFPGFQFHLFLESFSLFQIVDVADVDLRDFDVDIDWMDMLIDSTNWAYDIPGMGGLDSSPFKDKIVIIMYQP